MYDTFHPTKLKQTKYLFFTGKGGVGKTSTACATAVSLAELGKKVLIVSTDPASNLQDVFGINLTNEPVPIVEVEGLYATNLDPEEAAAAYRERVVGPYKGKLPESAIRNMEEQLSGACTVEIAAFDEFTNLLANPTMTNSFDHIIFDTAPTGHTLRLLQLPTAWSSFLDDSTHGASCLGPLSGLNEKKELYGNTVQTLSNREATTLVLVTRAEYASLAEADRASTELADIGITNQILIVNGVHTPTEDDSISKAYSQKQIHALEQMPKGISGITIYELPLVPFNLTGIDSLRRFFSSTTDTTIADEAANLAKTLPPLHDLISTLAMKEKGVIMTMGKGGVGKTTIAAAIAVGLAEQGHRVHLTTTDPAAHLSLVLRDQFVNDNFTISRIDPKTEVENYREEVLRTVSETLDEESLEYIKEDLNSPCTEEIAVFRAFANVVEKADNEFVVVDTAPTGHTLLLLDAAESYHQEITRSNGDMPESVRKLLPRLRNPEETDVILVTLAEATPVFEASRLQDDLRRADINPSNWVINQSMQATNTNDPILKGRAQSEQTWIEKVTKLSSSSFIIPWNSDDVIGINTLKNLGK
ncbi:arsenical pump-driving ATPase [Bacillus sp. FJAT-45350]|uniref:arsenical pump-driving ATPase n=1 Tax=Bacillus sp. FJAT-45350 TaxID=2011014 RepID=UPI000BB92BB7|nr:arsenical pump-driving ATPase [Bacillus sp. FJAT-45350]